MGMKINNHDPIISEYSAQLQYDTYKVDISSITASEEDYGI